MNSTTPAEELEALRNERALLAASLRQAEAEVEALKAERKAGPLLADVLAPAFLGTEGEELNDALLVRGLLTSKVLPWTAPKQDVVLRRREFSNLHGAVHGILACARLAQTLHGIGDGQEADPSLLCGLDCAMVALADSMADMLADAAMPPA